MSRYAESERLYAEAQRYLAGGVSSNFRYGDSPVPLFFQRGAGARLWDADGNEYIDYALGNGPAILGHAPAGPCAAAAEALGLGQLYAGQHPAELELARRLCRLIPCAERVRFSCSGTEAMQAAIRIARAATGRPLIVKFEGHYHGWLDNIFVGVRPRALGNGFEAGPESPGQAASVLGDIVVEPWNDLERLTRRVEADGSRIAAIIMEPAMCNTAVIAPAAGYLEGVRELCDRHGICLVFDEVITGFRLGLTGAQGLFGVTPDLAIFAKAVAAGFPLSVIAGRQRWMEVLRQDGVMHGGTYNSHVSTIAAALGALDALEAGGGRVYAQMADLGTRLSEGFARLARDLGVPLLVQGFPGTFHTAFTPAKAIGSYREAAACDASRLRRFLVALQDDGIRPTRRGTWFLSAAHTADDIDRTLEAGRRALAA